VKAGMPTATTIRGLSANSHYAVYVGGVNSDGEFDLCSLKLVVDGVSH
jgi:hypothetical protein